MEFLSPQTKQKIEKLEKENLDLKKQLSDLNAKNSGSGTIVYILLIAVFVALSAWQYFNGKSSLSDEEKAAIQVELWKNGEVRDTLFAPSSDLVFSVQIGAYKDLDISDISRGFSQMKAGSKDSLITLELGNYSSLPEAQKLLGIVVESGIENAFIVANKNGNAVGLLSNKTAN